MFLKSKLSLICYKLENQYILFYSLFYNHFRSRENKMSLSSRSSSSGHSSAGGNGPAPPVAYYAYRHPPSGIGSEGGMEPITFTSSSAQPNRLYFGDGDSNSSRKKGSVSVQNGALNLHIPCAFSYAYDVPVPPQPESQTRSSKAPSLRGRNKVLCYIILFNAFCIHVYMCRF